MEENGLEAYQGELKRKKERRIKKMYLYVKSWIWAVLLFFLITLSYIVFVVICSGCISQLYKKLQLAL